MIETEPRTRARLPAWLRLKLPATAAYRDTKVLLGQFKLHTVCASAKCPNHWECWSRGAAAFMVAGDRCTRACAFCAVNTAKPAPLDPTEPARVAEAAHELRLKHVVITSVARDDLPDGGAGHFHRTIDAVRARNPGAIIEVLTPDFNDQDAALDTVLAAKPDIFNHNLETVRRLTPALRSRASYDRSLSVLRKAKQRQGPRGHTKSGLMLGLGELEAEVLAALRDLRQAGCDGLTLGQYLQPTRQQAPVVEYVAPAKFAEYGRVARELGFRYVASGPLVRSSYHAAEWAIGRELVAAGKQP